MLQHINQFIELLETVEEVTVIKFDKLQDTVHVAHQLRDNIIVSASEIIESSDEKLERENKKAELAIQLQSALSEINVQVLDSTQELTQSNSKLLEQFAMATAKLQNDLVVVTGTQTAILAPLDIVVEETKIEGSKERPVEKREEAKIEESISKQETKLKGLEDKTNTALDADNLEKSVDEGEEVVTFNDEKTKTETAVASFSKEQALSAIVSNDQVVIEETKPTKPDIVSEGKATISEVEELKVATDTKDKIIVGKIEKMEGKVEITGNPFSITIIISLG